MFSIFFSEWKKENKMDDTWKTNTNSMEKRINVAGFIPMSEVRNDTKTKEIYLTG